MLGFDNLESFTTINSFIIYVSATNNEGVFNYTLYSNYYDKGGWQIDSYESYGEEEIKAKTNTLPTEVIENEVTTYNELFGELTFLEENDI